MAFTITKGMDNTFTFTVKQNGSTLPMVIDEVNDTFEATLTKLDDSTVPTGFPISLTVADAANGKIQLVVSQAIADTLISERGDKSDRYYPIPTYKLAIACNTTNNGNFIVKVPEVVID